MPAAKEGKSVLISNEFIEPILLLIAEFEWKSRGEEAWWRLYLLLELMDKSCGSSSPLQLLLSDDCRSNRASDRRKGVIVPVGEARARNSAADIYTKRKTNFLYVRITSNTNRDAVMTDGWVFSSG